MNELIPKPILFSHQQKTHNNFRDREFDWKFRFKILRRNLEFWDRLHKYEPSRSKCSYMKYPAKLDFYEMVFMILQKNRHIAVKVPFCGISAKNQLITSAIN